MEIEKKWKAEGRNPSTVNQIETILEQVGIRLTGPEKRFVQARLDAIHSKAAKRLYLSGPITGHHDYMDHFCKCEESLRAAGFDVINPARVMEPVADSLTYEEILAEDILLLLKCDGIFMMRGWEGSFGATIELALARQSGRMSVEYEEA